MLSDMPRPTPTARRGYSKRQAGLAELHPAGERVARPEPPAERLRDVQDGRRLHRQPVAGEPARQARRLCEQHIDAVEAAVDHPAQRRRQRRPVQVGHRRPSSSSHLVGR